MKFPNTKNEQNTVKPKVRKLLDEHHWFWWSGGATAMGKSGISDTLAVRPGVFMVVECKSIHTSHGRRGPTSLQLGFLNSIKAANHFAFVVNDDTLIHFQRFLELFELAAQLQAKNLTVPIETGGPLLDCIAMLMAYPDIQEPNQ